MKLVKSLLLFFTFFIFGQTQAQDIHWTMFDMSPLTLNPAYTGAFEGTFRVGGIYRDQWNSFGVDGFRTPSFYVDAPILMIGKRNWLSVGGMLYNDEAGRLGLTSFGAMGSAALHLGLNKKATTVLSIGLQAGTVQRRLDLRDATFDENNEIVDFIGSMNAMVFNDEPEASFLDVNAGVKLSSQLNKNADITIGMSFRHITTPDNFLSNGGTDDQPLLFILHGRFNANLNDTWKLSPAFIFQRIASANEIGIQVLPGYTLDEKKGMTLYFGPGYRMVDNDAIEAILRFDYKQFRVGAAYDFNTSSLSSVSNGRGGFEIAASYIAKIYKKPTVKPVIFCPKF